MVNFGSLAAEIVSLVWGTPANFNGFGVGFITAATSLNGSRPNFARCLAVSWAGTLCIHFRGFLSRNEFCHVQHSIGFQVLRSPILAALLHIKHISPVGLVVVSQTLRS